MKKLILTLLITFLYGFGFSQEKQKIVGPDVIQFKTENQLLLNELGLDSNKTDELCGSLLRFQKMKSMYEMGSKAMPPFLIESFDNQLSSMLTRRQKSKLEEIKGNFVYRKTYRK